MPVDDLLANRMRNALAGHRGISEKQMMGGLCFFLNGNMLCGARRHGDGMGRFMYRVGNGQEAAALSDPAAEPVIHATRKLGGFVRVNAEDCDEVAMQRWLRLCLAYAVALPAKD